MGVSARLLVNPNLGVRELRTLLSKGLKLETSVENHDDFSFITVIHRDQESRLYVSRNKSSFGIPVTYISTGSRPENIELLQDMAKVIGGMFSEGDTDDDFKGFQDQHSGNARFVLQHQILATAHIDASSLSDAVAKATGYEVPKQDNSFAGFGDLK